MEALIRRTPPPCVPAAIPSNNITNQAPLQGARGVHHHQQQRRLTSALCPAYSNGNGNGVHPIMARADDDPAVPGAEQGSMHAVHGDTVPASSAISNGDEAAALRPYADVPLTKSGTAVEAALHPAQSSAGPRRSATMAGLGSRRRSTTATATFVVPRMDQRMGPDDTLVVVGANVKLGAWNPLNGVALTRVNAHSSALSAQVGGFFPGTAIKFKLAIVGPGGQVVWEPGLDRWEEVQPSMLPGETVITCIWGQTQSQIISSSISEEQDEPDSPFSSAPPAAYRPPSPPQAPLKPTATDLVSWVLALSPGLSRIVANNRCALADAVAQQLAAGAAQEVLELDKQAKDRAPRSPQVAAMASLLLQTSPPSRAGSNGADIGAHEASMVASVVCRCSRWVQVLARDDRLAQLLVAQPQLAGCMAGSELLALALGSDPALVAALDRAPGLGAAMARSPALAAAVAAADGRLAACIAASPPLAAALGADAALTAAVAGGEGGDMEARAAGARLAECLVRDPSLLPCLTPSLTRALQRSPAVVELMASEREGLAPALAASNAALAGAVARAPVLARGLTGPFGGELAALLGSSPRLCAALTLSENARLAELMAEDGVLCEVLTAQPRLADVLASSRSLQQLLMQQGSPFVEALAASHAALFTVLAQHPDLIHALLRQAAQAAGTTVGQGALPSATQGLRPERQGSVGAQAGCLVSVAAALAVSPQAVAAACHCPELLRLVVSRAELAEGLLGHLGAEVRPRLEGQQQQGVEQDLGVEGGAGDADGEEGVFDEDGAAVLALLAGSPALCELLAKHPGLLAADTPAAPGTAAAAAAAGSSSLLPALARQPGLAPLLVARPALAAAAAARPALRRLLACDAALAALLGARPELATALVDDWQLADALAGNALLRQSVRTTPQLAQAITGEPRFASALGVGPAGAVGAFGASLDAPSAGSSSQPDLPAALTSEQSELCSALASSPDLCLALATSPQLCTVVASVAGLGPALGACPKLAATLAAKPQLVQALVRAPDLTRVIVASPKLAKALGSRRSPLSDLVSSNLRFACVLGAHVPLADAIAADPRMATLLAADDGLLAHAVCNVPALSQELASNLDALLANKQLATLVGRNPDMQELLLSSDFAAKIRVSRALQQLCSSEQLGPLLVKQRTLVQAVCSQPGLADALAQSPDLADTLIRSPVFGSAMARNPSLAAAVAAPDGRVAACLVASPALVSALGADPALAAAVAGATDDCVAVVAAEDGGEAEAEQRRRRGRAAGAALAEALVRDPALLPALTPALTRAAARSMAVVELVGLAAERDGLVAALAAGSAALAAAVARQPQLVHGLVGPFGSELADLLGGSPRLCAALAECGRLAAVIVEGRGLCETLRAYPHLADVLASSRSLQQLIMQQGPRMVGALSARRAALFDVLAQNPDLPAALLRQAGQAAAGVVPSEPAAGAGSSGAGRESVRGAPEPGVAPVSVSAALAVSAHAVTVSCHSPDLLRLMVARAELAEGLLGHLGAEVRPRLQQGGQQQQQLVGEEGNDGAAQATIWGAGESGSSSGEEAGGADRTEGAAALATLARSPELCKVLAQHPVLLLADPSDAGSDPVSAFSFSSSLSPSYWSAAASAATESASGWGPSPSGLLPALVRQPGLAALLVAQPAVAEAAAVLPSLRRLLAQDSGFCALLSSSVEVAQALVSNTGLTDALAKNAELREAVCSTPQLALAISNEDRLAAALGVPPSSPSSSSSFSWSTYSTTSSLDLPSSSSSIDLTSEQSELCSALASSPDLCLALATSPPLCAALASVPGLGPALAACPALASAFASMPALTQAVVEAPELANAVVANRRLAEVLGQTRQSPLAELVASNFRFASLLGANQPLADAITEDPRLAGLLQQDDGLLANAVCNNPALAQELTNNIDSLLTNKQLATLVGNNTDMQELLLLSSDFSAKISSSRALQQLCSNEELGPLLIKQRTLVQALCSQPGLADAMSLDPDLADALVKAPVLVQVITSNPEIASALVNSGELSGLITSNRPAASTIASILLIYNAAQRSQYLAALTSNQALTQALSKCPALVSAIAADGDLRDLVVRDAGISAAIVACPGFGDVLAFDKQLVSALTRNRPGIGEALSAGSGALARLLAGDSGLAKALARDEELAAALGAEGGAGEQLALALAACPELVAAVQARKSTARLVLTTPGLAEVLVHSPPLFAAIAKDPKLRTVLGASSDLRRLLVEMPSFSRTLTHPDAARLISEMARATVLVRLLAAHPRLLLAVSVEPYGHHLCGALAAMVAAARTGDPSAAAPAAPSVAAALGSVKGMEALQLLIDSLEPEAPADPAAPALRTLAGSSDPGVATGTASSSTSSPLATLGTLASADGWEGAAEVAEAEAALGLQHAAGSANPTDEAGLPVLPPVAEAAAAAAAAVTEVLAAAVPKREPSPEERARIKEAVEEVLQQCCARTNIPLLRVELAIAALQDEAAAAAAAAAATADSKPVTLDTIKAIAAGVLALVAAGGVYWGVATGALHPLPSRDELQEQLKTDVTIIYAELSQGSTPSSQSLGPIITKGSLLIAGDVAEIMGEKFEELASKVQEQAPSILEAIGAAFAGVGAFFAGLVGFGGGDGDDDDGGGGPELPTEVVEAVAVGGIVAAGSRVSGIGKGVGPAPDLRADPALDKRGVAVDKKGAAAGPAGAKRPAVTDGKEQETGSTK